MTAVERAASSDRAASHIVLVGLMGTGKSTIGRRLAKSLGRPFLDSDTLVEHRTGRTVRQIFAADGEPAFRDLEHQVLHEALASEAPSVIAAAGGAVLDARSRAELTEHSFVIWLQAAPAMLAKRVANGTHRPLLDDDPVGVLTAMATDRAELYAAVADAVVDVTPLSMDAAAVAVEQLVAELVP